MGNERARGQRNWLTGPVACQSLGGPGRSGGWLTTGSRALHNKQSLASTTRHSLSAVTPQPAQRAPAIIELRGQAGPPRRYRYPLRGPAQSAVSR